MNEILRIVREEWDSHYSLNSYCDSCKLKLVEYAFKMMDKEMIDVEVNSRDLDLIKMVEDFKNDIHTSNSSIGA